jgi:cytochrome P450 family 2 subfamily D
VIASLIYAHRFKYKDPDFIKMLKVLKENTREKIGLIPEVGWSRESVE